MNNSNETIFIEVIVDVADLEQYLPIGPIEFIERIKFCSLLLTSAIKLLLRKLIKKPLGGTEASLKWNHQMPPQ